MNGISASIKQAMISKGFLISVLGVTMVLLLASIQDMLAAFRSAELVANGYHDNLIAAALGSEAMALSLPILCALPFTASFVDDMKSGYIKAYLPRTARSKYIAGKAVGCAVSGGLALSLGILAAYGIAALLFLPIFEEATAWNTIPHWPSRFPSREATAPAGTMSFIRWETAASSPPTSNAWLGTSLRF